MSSLKDIQQFSDCLQLREYQKDFEYRLHYCLSKFYSSVFLNLKSISYFFGVYMDGLVLIAILHRDLKNDIFSFFFQHQFTFSNFYLDFYFPFSIWTFVSLFYLDFYSFLDFYFLFGLLFLLQTFIYPFCTNRDLILDFFQVFIQQLLDFDNEINYF